MISRLLTQALHTLETTWPYFALALLILALPLVGLTNLARLALLHADTCPPTTCSTDEQAYLPLGAVANPTSLAPWRAALAVVPAYFSDRTLAAELAFASGAHAEAAALLPPEATPNRSRLLMPERFEAALMRAYQHDAEGVGAYYGWRAFRTAFVLRPQFVTPEDIHTYFAELAAAPNTLPITRADALVRAGDAPQALATLTTLQASPTWTTDLSARELAYTWLTLGHARTLAHDTANARAAYTHAAAADPTWPLPPLALLASGVTTTSIPATPPYPLTAYTLTTPSGWTLLGYALDEHDLGDGGPLTLWLWWRAPANAAAPASGEWWPLAETSTNPALAPVFSPPPPNGDNFAPESLRPFGGRGLGGGQAWIQRQVVVNLIPNADFEWGTYDDGAPLGFTLGTALPTTVFTGANVAPDSGPDGPTTVVRLPTTINALRSIPVRLRTQERLLIGFWVKPGSEWATQVNCAAATVPLYDIAQVGSEPIAVPTWTHHASVFTVPDTASSPTPAGGAGALCHMTLYAGYHLTAWDGLLFARLTDLP